MKRKVIVGIITIFGFVWLLTFLQQNCYVEKIGDFDLLKKVGQGVVCGLVGYIVMRESLSDEALESSMKSCVLVSIVMGIILWKCQLPQDYNFAILCFVVFPYQTSTIVREMKNASIKEILVGVLLVFGAIVIEYTFLKSSGTLYLSRMVISNLITLALCMFKFVGFKMMKVFLTVAGLLITVILYITGGLQTSLPYWLLDNNAMGLQCLRYFGWISIVILVLLQLLLMTIILKIISMIDIRMMKNSVTYMTVAGVLIVESIFGIIANMIYPYSLNFPFVEVEGLFVNSTAFTILMLGLIEKYEIEQQMNLIFTDAKTIFPATSIYIEDEFGFEYTELLLPSEHVKIVCDDRGELYCQCVDSTNIENNEYFFFKIGCWKTTNFILKRTEDGNWNCEIQDELKDEVMEEFKEFGLYLLTSLVEEAYLWN